MSKPGESTNKLLKRLHDENLKLKIDEENKRETEFTTDINAVEALLSEAKKTQSSSEGYSLRAIGWALHSIAFDLHDINKKLSCNQTDEKT
jgi:hypothetical protein